MVISNLKKEHMVIDIKDLPYDSMLVPMVSFVENLPGQTLSKANSSQQGYLKLWFYLSILDFRYGGAHHESTNVVLKKDCIMLKRFGPKERNLILIFGEQLKSN